ncbi:MAG: FtsQ-type POTRA domain-containing protein [Ilumatobacteraceae bacterium]
MNDNHVPDPAALDELLRAFAVDPPESTDRSDARRHEPDPRPPPNPDEPVDEPVDAPVDAPVDDTDPGLRHPELTDAELARTVDEPEILIVEQDPFDGDEALASDPPPTVIRIDDYSGSVVIESESTPLPVSPPSPRADPLLAPADSGGAAPASEDDDAASDEPVVISIDADDLPDPVYVEGNLERSGTRSIVFIEDDNTGDTVVPEVERDIRRGIEPRMRERRAAVKRAIGRKRLRWILAIGTVVVVAVAALAVLGSNLFAIQESRVTVVGAVYADPARVASVVDKLVDTPALLADTQKAEAELEAIPWVESARVRVDFPHAATIEIRERAAMTTYQGLDGRYRVLDRNGRVLDVLDGYPFAYVLLSGPDPVDLEPGQFAPQGYVAASELAKTLTGSVRGQVEYVDVTADGSSLNLYLTDGTIVRFGAARDLLRKLVRLETVLTADAERAPGVIDVSTSEVTTP